MAKIRTAVLLAFLMAAAAIAAVLARPSAKPTYSGPPLVLETLVPKQFSRWRAEPNAPVRVVDPQTQQLLDKLYSQILTRVYVDDAGYRIMLSIAYGGDQREGLRAHRPEVCYPAQGFTLQSSASYSLATPFGAIAARRMVATLGQRHEPVTYWLTIGRRSVDSKLAEKWAEVKFGLTGRIPDGLLFRVSSIDPETDRAYHHQDEFARQLLAALPDFERLRVGGEGLR